MKWKQKLFRWMGLAAMREIKTIVKLYSNAHLSNLLSRRIFSVEAEAKLMNFLQKVFLFCCFFKSAEISTKDKWNGRVLNWRRNENLLKHFKVSVARTSSPNFKASQKFCDLIFLHYRGEKLLFVLRAFVTDFRSSLLFTFICFVSRAGKTRSGEQRREALNEQLENCFSHTLQT